MVSIGLPEDVRQRIALALDRQGARLPCGACGHNQFEILGYINHQISSNPLGSANEPGTALPVVVTVCAQCGSMRQHALKELGPLPMPPDPDHYRARTRPGQS